MYEDHGRMTYGRREKKMKKGCQTHDDFPLKLESARAKISKQNKNVHEHEDVGFYQKPLVEAFPPAYIAAHFFASPGPSEEKSTHKWWALGLACRSGLSPSSSGRWAMAAGASAPSPARRRCGGGTARAALFGHAVGGGAASAALLPHSSVRLAFASSSRSPRFVCISPHSALDPFPSPRWMGAGRRLLTP